MIKTQCIDVLQEQCLGQKGLENFMLNDFRVKIILNDQNYGYG